VSALGKGKDHLFSVSPSPDAFLHSGMLLEFDCHVASILLLSKLQFKLTLYIIPSNLQYPTLHSSGKSVPIWQISAVGSARMGAGSSGIETLLAALCARTPLYRLTNISVPTESWLWLLVEISAPRNGILKDHDDGMRLMDPRSVPIFTASGGCPHSRIVRSCATPKMVITSRLRLWRDPEASAVSIREQGGITV
jgi:hypothetical protein